MSAPFGGIESRIVVGNFWDHCWLHVGRGWETLGALLASWLQFEMLWRRKKVMTFWGGSRVPPRNFWGKWELSSGLHKGRVWDGFEGLREPLQRDLKRLLARWAAGYYMVVYLVLRRCPFLSLSDNSNTNHIIVETQVKTTQKMR